MKKITLHMHQSAEQSSPYPPSPKQGWRDFYDLLAAFAAEADPLYIVGGAVRDLWLSVQNGQPFALADLDLLTPVDALQTARRVADKIGWAYFALDAERDVARLVKGDGTRQLVCDVTTPRGGSLECDLRLRDFTINAMALVVDQSVIAQFAPRPSAGNQWSATDLDGRIIDLFDGRADLAARVVRTVTSQSLTDDPMRLVRAVRLATQFGFTLANETRRQIEGLAHLAAQCSAERVRDELWKAMATRAPAAAIRTFAQTRLLVHLLPEVAQTQGITQSAPHYLDVYEHTLLTVAQAARLRNWLLDESGDDDATYNYASTIDYANIENMMEQEWRMALAPWRPQLAAHFGRQPSVGRNRAQWLVWHALLHDVGKPATRTEEVDAHGNLRTRFFKHEQVGALLAENRLQALRFSRDEITLGTAVVRAHMHPHWLHDSFGQQMLSRRAMFRFFRKTGDMRTDAMLAIDVVLLALADYTSTHKGLIVDAFTEAQDDRVGALTGAQDDGLNDAREHSAQSEWRQYLEHIVQYLAFAFAEDGPKQVQQQPLVNGHVLMSHLGIAPGPQLGHLLEQLAEAQATGEISTAAEAIDWAARLLQSSDKYTQVYTE